MRRVLTLLNTVTCRQGAPIAKHVGWGEGRGGGRTAVAGCVPGKGLTPPAAAASIDAVLQVRAAETRLTAAVAAAAHQRSPRAAAPGIAAAVTTRLRVPRASTAPFTHEATAAGPPRLRSAAVLHPRAASRPPGCPPRSGPSLHAPGPARPGPATDARVGAPLRSSHGAGPEAALTPPRGRGRSVPPSAARGPLPASPVPAARSSRQLRVPARSAPSLPAPLSPSRPASPARRHGGHLPAPGRVCLQLHRVDRGGGGHRHQRLGGDLRLHHHHLPQDGRAGLQGAVGRLRHGDGPLPLQAAGGHPHPARYAARLSSRPAGRGCAPLRGGRWRSSVCFISAGDGPLQTPENWVMPPNAVLVDSHLLLTALKHNVYLRLLKSTYSTNHSS